MTTTLPAPVTLAPLAMADSNAAALTLGIAVYAAAILIGLGVGVNALIQGRRRRAVIAWAVVAVLTLAGVVIAIASSIG
ncbi:hypothetical protein GIY30_16540 [Gordonia sp. HNM0687]|uniref:Uncharacterized protein n=1 Tax=Gordonia mangrovi TaxID=2665643 RepID=A0A6L7GU14_9ACTN|nr:hypothetical protein [Gordonia mangrovi]MXP22947.1 hypothetical protein [Gordonia mangrovi]UVF77245.1 hypothetical protein NWF22_18350 [Gordonia mangrovi]